MASGEVYWRDDQTAVHLGHLTGSPDMVLIWSVSLPGGWYYPAMYSLAESKAYGDLLPHKCGNWPISSNKSHQPLCPCGKICSKSWNNGNDSLSFQTQMLRKGDFEMKTNLLWWEFSCLLQDCGSKNVFAQQAKAIFGPLAMILYYLVAAAGNC